MLEAAWAKGTGGGEEGGQKIEDSAHRRGFVWQIGGVAENNVFSGGASADGSGGCACWGREQPCPNHALFVPVSCLFRAWIVPRWRLRVPAGGGLTDRACAHCGC